MKNNGFILSCCLAVSIISSGMAYASSSVTPSLKGVNYLPVSVKNTKSSKDSKPSKDAKSSKAEKSSKNKSSNSSSSRSSVISSASASSRSTSMNSSSSIANCASYAGAVFIDSVCSPWRNPSIFEMNSVTFASREITDTNVGEGLSFSIVDSSDAGHHQVLDILYADQTIVNGVVHVFAPESASNSLDLSEYATGNLIFDIKVINEGTVKPDIELTVECGWPCVNTPEIIKSVALNQWQTVELSVPQMISRGLDITKVTTAFLLSPTWGEQANAHYQLDNIRWVKGSVVSPSTKICYSNFLDSPWISGTQGIGATVRTIDGNVDISKINISNVNPFVTIKPDWPFVNGRWALSLSEAISYSTGQLVAPSTLSACSSAGILSMEVYVPESYVTDGNLTFTLHFLDSGYQLYEIPNSEFSVANLKPSEWNKISVNLSSATQHENLMYVGLTFNSTYINPAINDVLRIDNIIITQKVGNLSSSSQNSYSSSSKTFSSSKLSSLSSSTRSSTSSIIIANSKSSVRSASANSKLSSSSKLNSSGATSSVNIQNVFIDQLDPLWKEFSAWETTKDRSFSAEYSDGTQAQLIHWAIVPSSDQGHNNIIDVQFTNNANYNGLFHITTTASEGVNMSEFATGKLVFDIKLLNAGNFSLPLSVLVECGYPCTSHSYPLVIPHINQWVTQEIRVADLISGGLDISKVNMAFEILPSWDKQTGVNFQLDNIRWVKGSTAAPIAPTPCYKQPFETWGLAFHFDWLSGSPAVISNALTQIIAQTNITPNWSSTMDKFGYAPAVDDLFAACNFANATLSAQIFLSKSYVDDGKMKLGFYYEDSSQRRAYFPPVSAAALQANNWTTISTGLTLYNGVALSPFVSVDPSFNASSITNVGIYFDANGKPTSVTGEISVDNIVIIKK